MGIIWDQEEGIFPHRIFLFRSTGHLEATQTTFILVQANTYASSDCVVMCNPSTHGAKSTGTYWYFIETLNFF